MKELEETITKVLQDMSDSGRIEEMIKNKVERCVGDILEEQLSSWSPFGKALKEALTADLAVNLDLGIGGYHARVLEIIRQKMDSALEGEWKTKLESQVAELL